MQEIKLSASKRNILCAETVAGPNAVVVFGASGDLVHRKLLVSIFRLYQQNFLDGRFYILGCGRKRFSDEDFRGKAEQSIRDSSNSSSLNELDDFTGRLYYLDGDYDDAGFYRRIKAKLTELDKKHDVHESLMFYLSVPPFLYSTIVDHLGSAQLSCSGEIETMGQTRLVVEKPFGRDLRSALDLNDSISRCFTESQIYRIDHYLGKETVQNILMLRFANTIYEPIWNRNYIDNVQITIAETVGVEHRAGYYDSAGALRDMFQNHMLQMLTLVAMEPPISFEADYIRDEKVKLLSSIRPFDLDRLDDSWVRGQYGPGAVNGEQVVGYLDESAVKPDSRTETFVAARLFIDNWRWQDVPFYLRTGKRLAAKDTEIAITFKEVPYSMFSSVGLDELPVNVLVLRIQPEEGISLSFQAKRPGSKICMSTLNMNFSYKSIFSAAMPEAYQRLLLDCMVGDQTLFTRQDDVEISWRLMTPILQAWEQAQSKPHRYVAGGESFPEADRLVERDGRKWRKLLQPETSAQSYEI
ncbi:MAG: glucose-6-phosphate dehydrogenase [Planctomycetota bacterium]|nr:glucose-6-phosphate dehydrogenase [Planctomycetota bacterium]